MTNAGRGETHCKAEGVGGVFSLANVAVPTFGLSLDGPEAGSRRRWELDIERADPGVIPRALMLGTKEAIAGPRPPSSGMPKLFPIARTWRSPRLGKLDALAWGFADTSPLQDAILIWLQFGRGEQKVRRAICHRARKWPMSSCRRDLIVDTALAHAPSLTYNQHPPAWLNYKAEFVDRVNEILRWIDRELQIANEATTLTRCRKKGRKCDNGIKESELPARFSESPLRRAA